MEPRDKVLREIWRWLPLFRAVAENQSVTWAARAFSVSPPAVSRALKQVEAALGQELLDRSAGGVSLNVRGHALLEAVAEAEARVAETLDQLLDSEAAGHVRIATVGQLGRVFIAPAARALAKDHPRLNLSVSHLEPGEAVERLKARTLDLFLALNVSVGDPLRAVVLADLEIGIYVGRSHPLYAAPAVAPEQIFEHPFAAQLRPGLMRSVWPKELKRIVTLETDSHAVALEACLAGSHVMAMERVVARPFVLDGRARELDHDLLPTARLALIHGAGLRRGGIISRVAECIRAAVKATTDAG